MRPQVVCGLFQGKAVEIIDINKLADKDGDKSTTVLWTKDL